MTTGPLRLVCFELRGQELALPIADVRETLPIQPITRVILTPPCLAGVFSLRGDIVPAIDLAVLLGLPRTEIGDDSRIVVVDRAASSRSPEHGDNTIGIVVDRLRDLRTIDAIEPPPSHLSPTISKLLVGVASTQTGTVRVLDAHAIVTADQIRAISGRAAEPEAGRH